MYGRHLTEIPKMALTRLVPVLNPDITPDPNDPNNYCASCQWAYPERDYFRKYLKTPHAMIIVPLTPGNPIPKLDIVPELNDPQSILSVMSKNLQKKTYTVSISLRFTR
jgi:hypothetical protein